MGQNPGDDKSQPSLELPSFPGLGRRKKRSGRRADPSADQASAAPATPDAEETTETTEVSKPVEATQEQEALATQPLATQAGQASTEPEPEPERTAVVEATEQLDPAEQLEPAEPRRRASKRAGRPRRADGLRLSVSGRAAAALTGLLVGVAGGAGTYGALAGCEAVRGVNTCGGGPGFFLLLAILAAMVLLGAALLKALGVAAGGSTSFLAVGIMTVVVMMGLLDVVYSPWMFVVVPVLGVTSYLLAHWVTTRFDAATPQRPDWT